MIEEIKEYEKKCVEKALELDVAFDKLANVIEQQEKQGIMLVTDEYEIVMELEDELGKMLMKLNIGKKLLGI